MSVMAISPISFVNATSLANTPQPEGQGHPPETNTQTSLDTFSSGSAAMAVQAFMAFQPGVQPIASLNPVDDMPQALPVKASDDFSVSTPEWSGAIVDVYA